MLYGYFEREIGRASFDFRRKALESRVKLIVRYEFTTTPLKQHASHKSRKIDEF